MNLREFFTSLSREEKQRLADDMGVKLMYLWNVACGSKPVSRYLAVALEEASRGMLKRQDLRPDIFKRD